MSMYDVFHSDEYEDGRTKQSFKDSTDINKLLIRAAKGETITHLAKHGAVYGDFSDIDDLLTAHERIKKGKEIFAELPSEVRDEFDNNIGKFYNFVNDPANIDRLEEVLPGLAQPGRQAILPKLNAEPPAASETPPAAAEGDQGEPPAS